MTEYVDYKNLYFNNTPITNQKYIKLNAEYGLCKEKVNNLNNLSNFKKIDINKSSSELPMVQAMSKITGNSNKNIMGTFYKNTRNNSYNKLNNKDIWITKNIFAQPQPQTANSGRGKLLKNLQTENPMARLRKTNPSTNPLQSKFQVPNTMRNKNIIIEYTDDNLKGANISHSNPESNNTKKLVKNFIDKFIKKYLILNNTKKGLLKKGNGIDDEQTFKASIIEQLEKQGINNISDYNQNKLVVEYDDSESWGL